jgi:hypothetical protein
MRNYSFLLKILTIVKNLPVIKTILNLFTIILQPNFSEFFI